MNASRVCIIGAGNMGRALIGGLLRAGSRAEQLAVAETDAAARARLAQELGVSALADAQAALRGAQVVVLAVKPDDAGAVLAPLAPALGQARPLLISVIAGVRLAALEALCPGVPVMRAMPNRPALLGAGATGAYAPPSVSAAERRLAQGVLGTTGLVEWLESEAALDVVTALSGSGPAYLFLFAELMAEAAVALGLESGSARRLAAATLYGTGLMVQSGAEELAQLRAAVVSPGGTTAAALAAFAAADLGGTVRSALAAAVRRSQELAQPLRA